MNNYLKKLAFLMLFLSAGIYGSLNALKMPLDEVCLLQDKKHVLATFEGHSEDGYKFLLKDGTSMLFSSISDELLETYDLQSDIFKGKSFEITYTSLEEDGEVVHKIIGLKELKPQEENS